jgi:nucleotide-binding universal stress UspA family protein
MPRIVCKDLDHCDVAGYEFVKRILMPYNDSRHAPSVFAYALTIAKRQNASILVVSIVNKDLIKHWVNGTPSRESAMSLGSVDVLKAGIKKMEQQAKKFGVGFDYAIIPSKDVSDSLLTLIDTQKIDLVVMGTKGHGMFKEMLLGRVSSAVAINAKCPVLLVK